MLREHRPNEVYNLAAQSFVQTSLSQPVLTGEVTALGVTRVLDAIRLTDPEIRFYQASSSEMFGKVREVPQTEHTPFYPRSPYGVAKVYGHWITVNYRESYGLHASSGILFNHESPRRGLEFVHAQGHQRRGADQARPRPRDPARQPRSETRLGLRRRLRAGDVGDAAAGRARRLRRRHRRDATVRELCEVAFARAGLNYEDHVLIDERFIRPAEVDSWSAMRPRRTRSSAGRPEVDFAGLVEMMVDADLDALRRQIF